jgi:hypothetical protein
MAGGPLAKECACFVCLGDNKITKATRVHEGVESDQYVCEKGHQFGVDYRKGPATTPQWPLPPETIAALTTS